MEASSEELRCSVYFLAYFQKAKIKNKNKHWFSKFWFFKISIFEISIFKILIFRFSKFQKIFCRPRKKMFRKIFFERIFISESHTVPAGSIPVPLVTPNPIAIEILAPENHENHDFSEKRTFWHTFVSFALENESNLILGLTWSTRQYFDIVN